MRNYKFFQKLAGPVIGGTAMFAGGFFYGKYKTLKEMTYPETWQNLPSPLKDYCFNLAALTMSYSGLDSQTARSLLPYILDTANIPHGDLAVPSKKVHSRRYQISQWQRVAVGAHIMVLAKDNDGNLCVVFGNQRGLLRHPQGYMETGLPKEDLTGLRAKNASRINGNTGELVLRDESVEDCAIREIYEEIGVTVTKDQLRFIEIKSAMDDNPPSIAPSYYVLLNKTLKLETIDTEFLDDDLSKPQWVRIKDIECKNEQFYLPNGSLPFDAYSITLLKATLKNLGYPPLDAMAIEETASFSLR